MSEGETAQRKQVHCKLSRLRSSIVFSFPWEMFVLFLMIGRAADVQLEMLHGKA